MKSKPPTDLPQTGKVTPLTMRTNPRNAPAKPGSAWRKRVQCEPYRSQAARAACPPAARGNAHES